MSGVRGRRHADAKRRGAAVASRRAMAQRYGARRSARSRGRPGRGGRFRVPPAAIARSTMGARHRSRTPGGARRRRGGRRRRDAGRRRSGRRSGGRRCLGRPVRARRRPGAHGGRRRGVRLRRRAGCPVRLRRGGAAVRLRCRHLGPCRDGARGSEREYRHDQHPAKHVSSQTADAIFERKGCQTRIYVRMMRHAAGVGELSR